VIGVLVSGSGTNLQALIDAGLPVRAVASNRADAYALTRAATAAVPARVFELEDYRDRAARDSAMADWLSDHGVQLVVCAGYMHLLTSEFLERFPHRVINVHPSLLPAFPGTHAIDDALAAGATETGVTVHEVDAGTDSGPILAQERASIEPDDTPESLLARLHEIEHRLLPDTTRRVLSSMLARGSTR
jgi:phosphoribosylglycinamide formyltransferase-1